MEALLPEAHLLAPLRDALKGVRVVSSPARRCRQTAATMGHAGCDEDSRLWEQDFGTQDGMAFTELPDLGPLPLADLAAHAAPKGESFCQMSERVAPALRALGAEVGQGRGPVVVIAHAGTARAALGLALGAAHLGLAFEIAPLSLTRLRCHDGGLGIIAVNQMFGPA